MCADAGPFIEPIAREPKTPGQLIDAELAKKDRENEKLRARVDAIEAECQRLRREAGW